MTASRSASDENFRSVMVKILRQTFYWMDEEIDYNRDGHAEEHMELVTINPDWFTLIQAMCI